MENTSRSQRARVLTEAWVSANAFCLACDHNRLEQMPPNTQARDFVCPRCSHPYELKSTAKPIGAKMVDGAFAAMMRSIQNGASPSFLLMRYCFPFAVADLVAVHRALITPEVIQRRKPLSATARRAGWTGCNILLSSIPPEGFVSIVQDGTAISPAEARTYSQRTDRLGFGCSENRSWARTLLLCLHRLPAGSFTLAQVYGLQGYLSALYPSNRKIRAKIRQQLQVLRDTGLLIFEGEAGTDSLPFRLRNGGGRSLTLTCRGCIDANVS